MNAKKTNQIIAAYLLKIGITIMVLLVSYQLYFRLDTSANKSFSLGKYSRQTVAGIKGKMVVKIYASKDLPAEFSNVNRYMQDLLAEYKRNSKGSFNYEYVRYKDAAELANLASDSNIRSMPVQIYENDSLVMKDIILALAFESEGRFDILQLYPGLEATLEYELTKKIQNVGGKLLPYMQVYQDTLFKYYPTQRITKELNENYKVGITDLKTAPAQTPVLLFTGTESDLSPEQLYNLDQYIMKGGKVVFLQDRIQTNQNGIFSMESNIFELLSHYGVLVHPNMVLDLKCIEGAGRGLGESMPYPVFPSLRGMDSNPITKKTDNTIMYFCSEISALDSLKIKFEPILQSSAKSGRLNGPVFNIEPVLLQATQYPLNSPPITVAAKIKGELNSYFAAQPSMQKPGFVKSRKDAEFIIFADRELAWDIESYEINSGTFVVMNAIDYFLNNLSLIQIRTRNLATSILRMDYFMHKHKLNPANLEEYRELSSRLSLIFKMTAIFLPMLFLGLLGFLSWTARRSLGRSKQ